MEVKEVTLSQSIMHAHRRSVLNDNLLKIIIPKHLPLEVSSSVSASPKGDNRCPPHSSNSTTDIPTRSRSQDENYDRNVDMLRHLVRILNKQSNRLENLGTKVVSGMKEINGRVDEVTGRAEDFSDGRQVEIVSKSVKNSNRVNENYKLKIS